MSVQPTVPPFFANPPQEYDANYFADVVRAFSVFIGQQRNSGDIRATEITFTNLPSGTDDSIGVGAVFEVDGNLKISTSNNPHCSGVSGSFELGSSGQARTFGQGVLFTTTVTIG